MSNLTIFYLILTSQVCDHYSVDFLEKGRMFWFESLFGVCTLLYIALLEFTTSLWSQLSDLLSLFILLPCFNAGSFVAFSTSNDHTYNPVMGISWLGSFAKVCFDVLKGIAFGDLIRLFSNLRQSDSVYLFWFVWDLVGRMFKMSALRQSVKGH